jgi:REP element-mobilizing transposase RayT
MNIISELLEEKELELKRTNYLISECEENIQKYGSTNNSIFDVWNEKKQFFLPTKEKIERQIKELAVVEYNSFESGYFIDSTNEYDYKTINEYFEEYKNKK